VTASKLTDAQKAFILKSSADGDPPAEICRKAGISEATYFDWNKKYEGSLRLACGVQQQGPELVGLGLKLLISVKFDAGTRNQLDLLLNA
jgi:Transposase